MSEADNRRRWPHDRRGVYEVWYTTWNDPKTGQGFWLRFITEAPLPGHGVPPFGDAPRGELWFARFDPKDPSRTFGIHERFAWDSVSSHDDPFTLVIAGCRLGNDHTFGELAGNGHDIRWDLRWEPGETLFYFPSVLYARGGLAQTTALSPNPHVMLSGSLLVDGEEIVFERAPAGQSHVWGKKHAYAWAWAHCNHFEGAPGAMFELIGARLQRRGVTLPTLTAFTLLLDGERIFMNQVRHVVTNRSSWTTTRVSVQGMSRRYKVEAELTARPEDMVNAPYVDPDGQELYCANTEIGSAAFIIYKRDGLGWSEYRRLESRGRMHFEVGSRDRDPAVTTPHVLVT